MRYLHIQGLFVEDIRGLGVAYGLNGPYPVIHHGLVASIWAGIVCQEGNEFSGGLVDSYGESDLTDIHLTDTTLTFTKKYQTRSDKIHYRFVKKDSYWEGEYEGEAVGVGRARCILTEMPESYFLFQ